MILYLFNRVVRIGWFFERTWNILFGIFIRIGTISMNNLVRVVIVRLEEAIDIIGVIVDVDHLICKQFIWFLFLSLTIFEIARYFIFINPPQNLLI